MPRNLANRPRVAGARAPTVAGRHRRRRDAEPARRRRVRPGRPAGGEWCRATYPGPGPAAPPGRGRARVQHRCGRRGRRERRPVPRARRLARSHGRRWQRRREHGPGRNCGWRRDRGWRGTRRPAASRAAPTGARPGTAASRGPASRPGPAARSGPAAHPEAGTRSGTEARSASGGAARWRAGRPWAGPACARVLPPVAPGRPRPGSPRAARPGISRTTSPSMCSWRHPGPSVTLLLQMRSAMMAASAQLGTVISPRLPGCFLVQASDRHQTATSRARKPAGRRLRAGTCGPSGRISGRPAACTAAGSHRSWPGRSPPGRRTIPDPSGSRLARPGPTAISPERPVPSTAYLAARITARA